jgi:3-oxoacyl-[acyl-carrier-protein] synthase-3
MLQNSGVAITGSGSATPAAAVDNQALSCLVETSDEWIASRTGIRQRRLAAVSESLSALATTAAQNALIMAGIKPADVDLIILATSTADDLFGSACEVQALLGATKAVAFDLTAACSGFIFGLVTAAQYIRTGVYQKVLLIGADILSLGRLGRPPDLCVVWGWCWCSGFAGEWERSLIRI